MSLIPNNLADVAESLIWFTLISSCPQLPDDIGDSDDSEIEEDDHVKYDEDDDLSSVPLESDVTDYKC